MSCGPGLTCGVCWGMVLDSVPAKHGLWVEWRLEVWGGGGVV